MARSRPPFPIPREWAPPGPSQSPTSITMDRSTSRSEIARPGRRIPIAQASTYWDSVTIAPGLGTGEFAAPSTFRLGTSNEIELYRNSHSALIAADLNGDGWSDLVTSPGAVLLTHAPTANHVPILSAGPDQVLDGGTQEVRFDAIASDADNDWLEFVWRDAGGRIVESLATLLQRRRSRHLYGHRVGRARRRRDRFDDGRGAGGERSVCGSRGAGCG